MINLMYKIGGLLFLLVPYACFAQFTVSGRVLNLADGKPVAGANVFLNNATIGTATSADGAFVLNNIKDGKYDLIVSNIGSKTFAQPIIVSGHNIVVQDIFLSLKITSLTGVTIRAHADLNRERYLKLFEDEFLGTSEFAAECKILNPEMLDFDYDDVTNTLKASSVDFLIIENQALGYRLKYLLVDFSVQTKNFNEKKVLYKGSVSMEEMKGSPAEERRWQRRRLELYSNSPAFFFKAALADKLAGENFRAQRFIVYINPERPSDSLINARVAYYQNLNKRDAAQKDSLSYWKKKLKLPVTLEKLDSTALSGHDVIGATDQTGRYELRSDNNGIVVAHNNNGKFHISSAFNYLFNRSNTDNTLIKFSSRPVYFYSNGVLADPYSIVYYGVWGRYRVAEQLPVDYEPPLAASNPGNVENDVAARLRDLTTTHPVEKAYLQFDKPFYAVGDTMYFKTYVTMGERHVPSTISDVLHVDLINPKNKIDRSIKLQVTDGVAWGDFALPDSLPKGNYRVRAWTRWMQNDPGSFFEKEIPIGSLQNSKVSESNTAKILQRKPDLQFFPESGELVAGIENKVAFKATGNDGIGVTVKGIITDNDNKQVVAFASEHFGMGSFALIPKPGKTYKAEVTYVDGSKDEIQVPPVKDSGITLSVNNDSIQKTTVRIIANGNYYKENKGKDYTLLIYSGGVANTVYYKLDSQVITINLIKRKLFTGITRITLFSPASEPMAERLIFIRNYDQLHLDASADKDSYKPRDKVNIKLTAKTRGDSAAMGHFSVAVTDESKVPIDENTETTILSDLLLTSDLKGYVEQPNYYFADTGQMVNESKLKELDLVMLTNGYRRFVWKQVLARTNNKPTYQPETGLTISGIASNMSGIPLAKGTVSLIPAMGAAVQSQATDDQGNFSFNNLVFMDSARFVLNATYANGNNNTKLALNADTSPAVRPVFATNYPDGNSIMDSYLKNAEKLRQQLNTQGIAKGRTLNEVKIKGIKENNNYRSSSLLGPGHADQVMRADEIEKFGGSLSNSLNGRLRGVTFVGTTSKVAYLSDNFSLGDNTPAPMLLVIDGVPMSRKPATPIDIVNPNNVETIEVLRFTSTSIYGIDGGNGVIVITTKQGRGLQAKEIASRGILTVAVQGFYKGREFYSPKYEHPNDSPNSKDLRSTVYWQPELITDKDGSTSFSFYSADGAGKYRVVIEGLDENGNLGRKVYYLKVQ